MASRTATCSVAPNIRIRLVTRRREMNALVPLQRREQMRQRQLDDVGLVSVEPVRQALKVRDGAVG